MIKRQKPAKLAYFIGGRPATRLQWMRARKTCDPRGVGTPWYEHQARVFGDFMLQASTWEPLRIEVRP